MKWVGLEQGGWCNLEEKPVVLMLFSDPTGNVACVLEEYTKYYESGVENPLEPAARDEPIGPQRRMTVNLWKGD
jgi:hypothetical protein